MKKVFYTLMAFLMGLTVLQGQEVQAEDGSDDIDQPERSLELTIDYLNNFDKYPYHTSYPVYYKDGKGEVGSLHIPKQGVVSVAYLDINSEVTGELETFKGWGDEVFIPHEMRTLETLLNEHNFEKMDDNTYLNYLNTLHPVERESVEEYHKVEADGGNGGEITVDLDSSEDEPTYARMAVVVFGVATTLILILIYVKRGGDKRV